MGEASGLGAKTALRRELLARRAARSSAERTAAGLALAERAMDRPEMAGVATVAAYASVGSEPPTYPLLAALQTAGKRVLLPVLRHDGELDWAAYDGRLVTGPRGLREPAGEPLGVAAVAAAGVLFVPGLAADRAGWRLGRGGGCYDRALARAYAPAYLLLYDDELLGTVPHEPHDRRVDGVITPRRVLCLGDLP